jgi:hypothetical protein
VNTDVYGDVVVELAAELRVLHRSDVECDRERLVHLLDRVDEAIDLVVQRMGTRSS